MKHEIDTGEARPIIQAPRCISLSKRNEVKELVRMKRSGLIQPSSGPWNWPIVLVEKKDSTRLCVDYRNLNDVTKKDSYPPSRIDDTLAGTKWLSTLDLKSGCWQMEIARTRRKLYSVRSAAYDSLKLCHLDSVMLRPHSSGLCNAE